MDHQDWSVVTFNKKQPQKNTSQKAAYPPATVSSKTGKPAWKIEQQVDSENGKPINRVSKDDSKRIVELRLKARLSQRDLEQKMNLSASSIKDIEAGTAVENKALLSRIIRFLTRLQHST